MDTNLPTRAPTPAKHPDPAPTWLGGGLAVSAFLMWSMFPLYFKLVAHISPLEVLAHRMVWTLAFVTLIMVVTGRREIFQKSFYAPKTLGFMALSALAVAVNWGVFIAAVSWGQVLQSSLGYFISPLMSVLFGVFILSERPRPLAWVAIAIAALAVANLVWNFGAVPWIALWLGLSWGLYGLLRKLAPLGSISGLYTETLLMLPLALAFLVYLHSFGLPAGMASAGLATLDDGWLLVGVGALTATPLLLFARAVRLLPLSAAGVLQYIVPTGQFILAVFVFGEPFGDAQLLTFVMIWAALALYIGDSLRAHRRRPAPPPAT